MEQLPKHKPLTVVEAAANKEYRARKYKGMSAQRLYHLTHGHIQTVLAKGSHIAALQDTYRPMIWERIGMTHRRMANTHRRLGDLITQAENDPDAMEDYNHLLPYLSIAGFLTSEELESLLATSVVVSTTIF